MDSHPQRQSSFVLGLRAVTMLAGLVAVPLAAIFGSSLPEFVKRLSGEHAEEQGDAVVWNTTPRAPKTEAPRFDPFSTAASSQQPASVALSSGVSTTQSMPAAGLQQATTTAGPTQSLPPQPQIPAPAPQPVASGSQTVSPGTERFTWMERRLRDLGATYYLLEAWGADGGLFRFHCKMAIAGNPQLNRQFEAIDPDPLRAMERVLDQVEASRMGP